MEYIRKYRYIRNLRMELPDERKRGRPKVSFIDLVEEDMREVGANCTSGCIIEILSFVFMRAYQAMSSTGISPEGV